MHRRAYVLLIGIAALMGTLALVTSISIDKPLVDPDGFLGPSWVRLPLLISAAFLLDMLPRVLWNARGNPLLMKRRFLEHWRNHWTRDRLTLVLVGLVCFYITYVSYRNLKSFLPFVIAKKYDTQLHHLDTFLFFGNEPAIVLHNLLGDGVSAHLLSTVYLWFLPLTPLALTAWLIWSRNISFGYWFATSQCLTWSLGTASYYAVPTLGPGFEYSFRYADLATTGSRTLMGSLSYGRHNVLMFNFEGAVQSVAGFASLHCAITLLVALMIQYTVRTRILHWIFWVNFGLTVVATLYFGWHYIADDIAGVAIALLSFYVGGVASGQKFDRHGFASHPTTTTASVPVDD
ncbi:MAG TPA: phosphatase PAP2 family protein [Nocardioides sp.]